MEQKNDKLDIINFEVFENLNECVDSLLFDDETIAELETKQYTVTVEVIGDIRLFYKGQLYKCAANYPDELVKLLKSGKAYENKDLEIWDNNWFEIDIYELTKNNKRELINDEVLDSIDISTITKDDLKDYMSKYLKDYLELCEKEISNSEYNIDI